MRRNTRVRQTDLFPVEASHLTSRFVFHLLREVRVELGRRHESRRLEHVWWWRQYPCTESERSSRGRRERLELFLHSFRILDIFGGGRRRFVCGSVLRSQLHETSSECGNRSLEWNRDEGGFVAGRRLKKVLPSRWWEKDLCLGDFLLRRGGGRSRGVWRGADDIVIRSRERVRTDDSGDELHTLDPWVVAAETMTSVCALELHLMTVLLLLEFLQHLFLTFLSLRMHLSQLMEATAGTTQLENRVGYGERMKRRQRIIATKKKR